MQSCLFAGLNGTIPDRYALCVVVARITPISNRDTPLSLLSHVTTPQQAAIFGGLLDQVG